MGDRIVRVVVAGDSAGAVRAFRQTDTAAKRTAATLDATSARAGKFATTMASFGRKAAFGVVGAAGLGGYQSIKGVINLQKSMERLRTQAGATQPQVAEMTKAVIGMAESVGTGPQGLSLGLYHVVSSLNSTIPAAKRVSTEMAVLKIAAEGAKVGNADLVDVTNALDAAIVSGIRGVQNYGQAMGALNAIVGAGDMSMQDLADALGTGLLANVKTFGLTLRDTGGALAVFGDNNIRGADAATKLAAAVRIMGAPSGPGVKQLAAIGLSARQLADDMRSGGLIKAVGDLRAHLAGLDKTSQAQVLTNAFGRKQAAGVLLLVDQFDRLKAKTADDVGKGAKGFSGDWAATTKTVSFQIDQIKAGLQGLADTIGGKLLPVTGSILTWILKNKRTMKDLGEAVAIAAGAFLTFKAAMIAGRAITATMVFLTGGWVDAFWALNAAMYANPIGLVIAAVALLAGGLYLLYTRSATVRHAMNDMWSWMKHASQDAINFVIHQINRLLGAYNSISGWIHKVTGGVLGGGRVSLIGDATYANPGKPKDAYGAALAKNRKAPHANAIQQLTGIRPGDGHPTVVEHHTHIKVVMPGGRVLAEAVARENLQLAARR